MEWAGLTRCPECPGTTPVIPSDGPMDSPILFIGEKPGKEENNRGRCFVGQTGREFNEHLVPLSGFTRDQVRMTNATRCFNTIAWDDPRSEIIKNSCANWHLRREMAEQNPKVVVTMGAAACSLVSDLNVEMCHGLPVEDTVWWGTPRKTFPTYHPAAGLHQTSIIQFLREDFISLGQYMSGKFSSPVDEYAGVEDYRLLSNGREVNAVLIGTNPYAEICIDTEYDWDGIWCLTFSVEEGTGYMIKAGITHKGLDMTALAAFRNWLNSHRGMVTFHNAMADVPMLESIGCFIRESRVDDTMVRAYHLQNQPQALKILAYRLCGMAMQEFEDVVIPYSLDIMLDFIINVSCDDWPKPEPYKITKADGSEGVKRPQGLNTKLKRLITDFEKKPVYKTLKRWNDWSDEEKLPVLARHGSMPRPSIRFVPLDKALFYACRDADATLRVRNRLARMARFIRKPGF